MTDNKHRIPKATNEADPLPVYPVGKDIYNTGKKLENTDPADLWGNKTANTDDTSGDENKYLPGNDLDIPGTELDDAEEVIGSEDEENNYYSIGGDDHNELDEDKGG